MDFESLTLAHRPVVDKYSYLYGEGSCQHSFASMFCFNGKYNHSVCETKGWLFVCREKLGDRNHRTYLMPMGGGDPAEAIGLLWEDARSRSVRLRFETVTESGRKTLETYCPGIFEAEERRDYMEYIYKSEKLANLPGGEMASKRYDVHTFWSNYSGRVSIREMTAKDAEEVCEYQAKWLKTCKHSGDEVQLELENEAILLGLENFEALGLSGILLYIDGVLRGYAYGSAISNDCYDFMIEKGDREVEDIYRILNMETVRRCCSPFSYVNREEDLGVPGLRKAKLSYKPDILLKKYVMKEAGGE